MTAAFALAVAAWKWGGDWIQTPTTHELAFVFLITLWTFIGLTWLAERKKPTEIFPKKDFRYGLTFEGLSAVLDPRHEASGLQISVGLRNYSPIPIKYHVGYRLNTM
jgi:hypothetical protein